MRRPAVARRAVIELARIGFGVGDQRRHRIHGQRPGDRDDEGTGRHQRNRDEVVQRIERQLRPEMRRHHHGAGGAQQQGVAVGRGVEGDFRADHAIGTGAIVDHDRLPQRLAERRCDRAADKIGTSSGGEGDDETDGLGRIGLGGRRPGREQRRDQENESPEHPKSSSGKRGREVVDEVAPSSLQCRGIEATHRFEHRLY